MFGATGGSGWRFVGGGMEVWERMCCWTGVAVDDVSKRDIDDGVEGDVSTYAGMGGRFRTRTASLLPRPE